MGWAKGRMMRSCRKGYMVRPADLIYRNGKSNGRKQEDVRTSEERGGICECGNRIGHLQDAGKAGVRTRAGHYGICDLGGGSSGYRHNRHNRVQAEVAGIVERDRRGNIRFVGESKRKQRARRLGACRAGRWKCQLQGLSAVRRKRLLARVLHDEGGQSTVEYAIVLGALLCVLVAVGLLARAVDSGMLVQHALMAASHNVSGSVGGAIDVFAY